MDHNFGNICVSVTKNFKVLQPIQVLHNGQSFVSSKYFQKTNKILVIYDNDYLYSSFAFLLWSRYLHEIHIYHRSIIFIYHVINEDWGRLFYHGTFPIIKWDSLLKSKCSFDCFFYSE